MDPNFLTGRTGLIAVDKVGNRVLFLHPETFAVEQVLDGFVPRVHEVLVSGDHRTAYVPIYGDGIHGNNPRPGHHIAVIDLVARSYVRDINTAPHVAPHGLRWGPAGQLYCVCENSGVVLEIDPADGAISHVIPIGSDKAHRIEVLPDGTKLYSENEEDTFGSVVDLATRRFLKAIPIANRSAGIGMSPDGPTVVLVDAKRPDLLIVDTKMDEITRVVRLESHREPAQIARYSPDGRYLVVTSHEEPLGTVLDASLDRQRPLILGGGPMNMAFHPDGDRVVIANQDDGSLSIVHLDDAKVLSTKIAPVGVEALSFF